MKYLNFKRYKFSTIFKNVNSIRYNFLKNLKSMNISRFEFGKIYRFNNIIKYNLITLIKYLSKKIFTSSILKSVNFNNLRNINLKANKFIFIHLPSAIIFFGFLYLLIPTLYNYEAQFTERLICKTNKVQCKINGKINYVFYPTPRIKINNLTISKNSNKNQDLINIDNATLLLSFKNLLVKEKQKVNKIKLKNFQIKFDFKNLKNYKNIYLNDYKFLPIIIGNGKITLFNKTKYVGTINDVNSKLFLNSDIRNISIKGNFLENNLSLKLNNKKIKEIPTTNIILKIPDLNLLSKIKLNHNKNKSVIGGNIFLKKNKQKFTGVFRHKDDKITINTLNLRNSFLDGKLNGMIKFVPFFDFDLDLSLNSINIIRLYSYFLSLDEKRQKSIFKISKKINGKISLSSDRVYSSYNLIKSFESILKFNNGNIFIEQFLVNLGKLGAADLLGSISNNKKFTNFNYESNIYIDNEKKFLRKMGLYNDQIISPNLFVSGNFELQNIRNSFYEILINKKLNEDDINFIEKEFNDIMLEKGYENLFRFPKFKEFIKSVASEKN
jgi:hypothetical protein